MDANEHSLSRVFAGYKISVTPADYTFADTNKPNEVIQVKKGIKISGINQSCKVSAIFLASLFQALKTDAELKAVLTTLLEEEQAAIKSTF